MLLQLRPLCLAGMFSGCPPAERLKLKEWQRCQSVLLWLAHINELCVLSGSRIIQEGRQLLYAHLAHLGRLPAQLGAQGGVRHWEIVQQAECSNMQQSG